jgi:hypothetical protein
MKDTGTDEGFRTKVNYEVFTQLQDINVSRFVDL